MPVDTAALRIAINRSKQAEPSDALGHLDHALTRATSDIREEAKRTRTISGAMALANMLKAHIETLSMLQTDVRCKASAFISEAVDPFNDE